LLSLAIGSPAKFGTLHQPYQRIPAVAFIQRKASLPQQTRKKSVLFETSYTACYDDSLPTIRDDPMARVAGKIAMVTGAATGLGKADAWRLAEEGATVILTDVNKDGEALAREISEATGQTTRFFLQDVADEQRWGEIIDAITEEFGGLDVLVNNAGIAFLATPENTTLEQFRRANAVMSEGVFLGCRAAIPAMKQRGGGSIINMSSTASHLGYPVYFAYTAAKGAVRSMTKAIAVHCQMNGYNIRCNSVHPGAIDTQMVRDSFEQLGLAPPDPDKHDPGNPVGIGRPEDVANLVLFLASDESRFVNGAELMIDNALTVQ
jgi:3(or 17)beta-hydroxysteroid dehydrogenase